MLFSHRDLRCRESAAEEAFLFLQFQSAAGENTREQSGCEDWNDPGILRQSGTVPCFIQTVRIKGTLL